MAAGVASLLPGVQRLQVGGNRLRIRPREAVLGHRRARVLVAAVHARHQKPDRLTLGPALEARNLWRCRKPARDRMHRLEIKDGALKLTPCDLLTPLIVRRVAVSAP